MDLLTAIMHEIGHRAGLADSYSLLTRDDLMYGYLTKGERRLPSIYQALFAMPDSNANHGFLLAREDSSSDVSYNAQSRNGPMFIANAVKQPAQKQTENSEVRNQKAEVRSHHAKSVKADAESGGAETRVQRPEIRSQASGANSHHARTTKPGNRNATLAAMAAPMSGETVTANIGTLPAGS